MINKRVFCWKGQGLVEYILITALIALAAVAIFRSFRQDVKEAFRRAGQTLLQGVSEGPSQDEPAQ